MFAISSSSQFTLLTALRLLCLDRRGNAPGRLTGIRTSCIRNPGRTFGGAVFTVRRSHHQAYWINTSFDVDARHFQYVYLIPEVMIVLIDVRFSDLDPGNTEVSVAYERTALNPEANEHVKELGNSDRESKKEWGTAINDYLAKRKVGID